MEVTTVAVGCLLQKLFTLGQDEYKLQKGVKRDIKVLSEELQMIQAAISDASAVGKHRLADDVFSREIRELSYDIEDSLDSFMIGVGHEPYESGRFINKCKNLLQKLKSHHKISQQIRDLRSRAEVVIEHRTKYTMDDSTVSPTISRAPAQDSRLLALFADASGLVGMDRPRAEITKMLLMEEEESESAAQLRVVSIVGSGGMGKTTLAKVVYEATREYFPCTAWVSVSPNHSIRRLLVAILRQVEDPSKNIEDPDSSWGECYGERDLIGRINERLRGIRYLIVLDDLWSTETLKIIKPALPMNGCGSRVITTTRSHAVAKSCCMHWDGDIYYILPLSSKDSLILFQRRIFGAAGSCPKHLLDLAYKFLRKCSGVPLAIISIAALLATRAPTTAAWGDLCNSIVTAHESIEGMREILLLSYYDLPHSLKVCFLYLSIFPEDYPINCDRIIRCWIAEGFISENHENTSEEVGENYLTELFSRNMIQPVHDSYDGKPEAFLIYGMMHDFIKSKSAEENFVTLLENEKPLPVLQRKIRRLSVLNTNKDRYIQKVMTESHIRSLFIFGRAGLDLSINHFPSLRLLDLEGCKDLKGDSIIDIAELCHLRYLSIRDTPISVLPEKIGRLKLLKTLDLRGTSILKLPRSIVQLQKLAHLHCDKMGLPEGIGKMTELSCLAQFDILESGLSVVKQLGNLVKLCKLEIWWLPDEESNNIEIYQHLAFSLGRLSSLKSLSIHGYDGPVDFLDILHHPLQQLHTIQLNCSCYISRIPKWFELLESLEYLCIDVEEVKNEDLQLLSELSSLRHLSLSSRALPTERFVIPTNGFPILQKFDLQPARADLTFERRTMQKLRELLLTLHALPEEKYCFPIDISEFTCLNKVDIRINGKGASASKLFKAANLAIRKAADEHPNHPMVNIVLLANPVDNTAKDGKGLKLDRMKNNAAEEGNKQKLEPVKAK